MPTKKKRTNFWQKYYPYVAIVLAVLLLVAIGWALHERNAGKPLLPTTSRLAYVDGNDAVIQVSNFYNQYLADANNPTFQKRLVSVAGDRSLTFYDEYYRHGFDPITCSTILPTSVKASLVSTGPVATVAVHVAYPDHTTATITAKVTLSDRLEIDSITCPGSKGNLPPDSSN